MNITCPNCARELSVQEPGLCTCPHCSQVMDVSMPIQRAHATPAPIEVPPQSEFEKPLFSEAGVLITRSQVVSSGAIFAVPQIAGVVNREIPAKRTLPVFFLLMGIPFAATGGYVIASMMMIPSILLLAARRTKYTVALQANGTEYNLEFLKIDQAQRAAWALSQAMSAR